MQDYINIHKNSLLLQNTDTQFTQAVSVCGNVITSAEVEKNKFRFRVFICPSWGNAEEEFLKRN